MLPGKLVDIWTRYIVELVQTAMIQFRRCVRPEGEVKEFALVVFFMGVTRPLLVWCTVGERWLMGQFL